MFKKLIGVFVLMFLMAIAIPVLAQRYDSCNRRGHSSYSRYDRGRDHGYRGDYGRRNNRRVYYGGNNGYYAPAYYPRTYYAPSNYYVVRRPVRRVYSGYGYRPYRRHNRSHVSFTIGF